MSEVTSFFRHCPACGRRFHIKLTSKTLVDVKRESRNVREGLAPLSPSMSVAFRPVVLLETVPATFDIEDFQYQYKCGHCGHEWTENKVKVSRE